MDIRLKKILPYAFVVLFFLVAAYGFVPQVLEGKMVNQSDISGYVGMSHSQYAHEAVVHGREAAYEAGVVPEGATLQYEVDETAPSAEAYDDGLNDAYDAAPSEAGRPQRGQRLRGFGRRAGRDADHEPEPFAEAFFCKQPVKKKRQYND